MFRRTENRVARYFCACPGGGWNGYHRERPVLQRLALSDDFQVIEYIAGIRVQRSDCLGGIQRAPAAEAQDQIALLSSRKLDAFRNDLQCWLASD
jgi:hypothetical protein